MLSLKASASIWSGTVVTFEWFREAAAPRLHAPRGRLSLGSLDVRLTSSAILYRYFTVTLPFASPRARSSPARGPAPRAPRCWRAPPRRTARASSARPGGSVGSSDRRVASPSLLWLDRERQSSRTSNGVCTVVDRRTSNERVESHRHRRRERTNGGVRRRGRPFDENDAMPHRCSSDDTESAARRRERFASSSCEMGRRIAEAGGGMA